MSIARRVEGITAVRRLLPTGAWTAVSVGDSVVPSTTIATLEVPTGPLRRVNCAQRLGCRPEALNSFLRVRVGSRVADGQVLASRIAFESPLTAESPCPGRVALVSTRLGFVYVRSTPPRSNTPVVIDLKREFQCSAPQARRALRVGVGQRVAQGHPVATQTLGYASRHVVSPVAGTVRAVSTDGSILTIEPEPTVDAILAGVAGRVTEIVAGKHMSIEVVGLRVPGVFGVGGPAWGTLRNEDELREPGRAQGAVVLMRRPPDASHLRELREAGAVAVVAPALDQSELVRFLGTEIRLGITPAESQAGLTIVSLRGFGSQDPAEEPEPYLPTLAGLEESLDQLQSRAGCPAYVDGRTQVRAGVRRPFIVVTAMRSGPAGAAGPEASARRESGERVPPAVEAEIRPAPAAGASRPSWVYPCCLCLTNDGYFRRFGEVPAPWPAPSLRDLPECFRGLVMPGAGLARQFENLARRAAAEAVVRLRESPAARPPHAASGVSGASHLLTIALLPAALRREERRRGLWEGRSELERECPAFLISDETPATVVRAVPAQEGRLFLVLLGRASGWTPYHLQLLGRSDVGLVMATLDRDGQVHRVGNGFRALKALGLVASFLEAPVGRLMAPTLAAEEGRSVLRIARAEAEAVAAALAEFWPEVAEIAEAAGGFGDSVESLYAHFADAVLVAGRKAGLFPAPVMPRDIHELADIEGSVSGTRLG